MRARRPPCQPLAALGLGSPLPLGAETKPVLIFTARAAGARGAAGQMASGTKGQARVGAGQIGNFLPVPLPCAQSCWEQGCLAPVAPPKACGPLGGTDPRQLLWPLKELRGETQNADTPNPKQQNPISVLLLMRSCESRTPGPPASVGERGPQLIPERRWLGTGVPCRVPPWRLFPLPLQFSYLFPAKSQLPPARSEQLINNQLLLPVTSRARLQMGRRGGAGRDPATSAFVLATSQ